MNSLYLYIFIACHSEEITYTPVMYEKGVLIPPFEHGNSGWAGVSLLDYDNDGLLDIFFTNGQSLPDALYKNQGDGTFVDVAAEVGLDIRQQHGGSSSGDLDNDGDPDLVITQDCSLGTLNEDGNAVADGNIHVYINKVNEHLGFVKQEISIPEGLIPYGFCPVSVDLVDLNADGYLDIFVSNGLDLDQTYPWIYRKEVREAVDFHLFGGPDLDFSTSSTIYQIPSELYQPEQAGILFQFVTFTSAFFDMDEDGDLDRIAGFGGGQLSSYMQNDDGSFEIHPEWIHAKEGLWMGLAVADFNQDQEMDIYVTNQGLSPLIVGYDNIPFADFVETEDDEEIWYNGQYLDFVSPFHQVLTKRKRETFWKTSSNWSLSSQQTLPGDVFDGLFVDGNLMYEGWSNPKNLERLGWGWATSPIDFDADGLMDVVWTANNCSAPLVVIGEPERGAGSGGAFQNNGDNGFVDQTYAWNVANTDEDGFFVDGRGLAVGDLNNDGFPDIVYANRTFNPTQSSPLEQRPGKPNIYLSTGTPNNWLQIDLEGTQSNRDGIGSDITVWYEGKKQRILFGTGGQTNSSNERIVIIGVGRAEEVDIEVKFQSGTIVQQKSVLTNQRITIVEE